VQRRGRPGFDRFVERLFTLGLGVEVRDISEDVYAFARTFSCASNAYGAKAVRWQRCEEISLPAALQNDREEFCLVLIKTIG
jgi:hypothetical protein